MITLITYHPASVFYAGKGVGGPSRDSLLRFLKEDVQRVYTLTLPKREESSPQGVLAPPLEEGFSPQRLVALDTEFNPEEKTLTTVGLSDGKHAMAYEDLWEVGRPPEGRTLPLLDKAEHLIGHNIAEDVALLWEYGLLPKREGFVTGESLRDSLLLAKSAFEDRPSYGLEGLLSALFTVEAWKTPTAEKPFAQWTPAERKERCRLDAWAAWHVARHEWQGDTPLRRFTHRIAQVLHRMALAGAILDLEDLAAAQAEVATAVETLRSRLAGVAQHVGMAEIALHNDHAIRTLLYEKLGCPVRFYTEKTGLPAVTREALADAAESAPPGVRRAIEMLQEYNRWEKIQSTYTLPLSTLVTPVGRLDEHIVGWLPFNIHPYGARTGRRSSSRPNSQNWPMRVRRLVRSRWEGGRILECDYKKLEPVILAWLAKSERLLQYFTTGGGYLDVARTLFHTEVAQGTLEYRAVKSIVLGVHYDMRTPEMAHQLWANGIRFSADYEGHATETDRLRRRYLAEFPEISQYMARQREEAQTTGKVVTPVGRVRHVGVLGGKRAFNQAINTPVQSTAGDITGSALIDIEQAILAEAGVSYVAWYDQLIRNRRAYVRARGEARTWDLTAPLHACKLQIEPRVPMLFNEVHDATLVDLPPEWVSRGTELVVESMRRVPTLRGLCPTLRRIPLDVEVTCAPRWGGTGG